MSVCLVTPTWHGDLHHFQMLRRSLRRYGLDHVPHIVVVHTEDRDEFCRLESGGMRVMTTSEVLPADVEHGRVLCARRNRGDGSRRAKLFRSVSKRFGLFRWANYYGWQVQQITKLYVPLSVDYDVCVVLDSDLILCGPLEVEEFLTGGRAQLVEKRTVITPDRDRHVCRWAKTAHQLLGEPYRPLEPINYRTDTPVVLDREVIGALHAEVQKRHGAALHEVLLKLKPMSWSEFLLYNVFAERFVGTRLERRACAQGLKEICIESGASRLNAARLIRLAFESPDIRLLRIVSEARDRARWTGAEFERHIGPYMAMSDTAAVASDTRQ